MSKLYAVLLFTLAWLDGNAESLSVHRLSCAVSVTWSDSNGTGKRSKGAAFIEVTEAGDSVVISITSGVTSIPKIGVLGFSNKPGSFNRSTPEKWDVGNRINSPESLYEQEVYIERTDGSLVGSWYYEKGRYWSREVVTGQCEKSGRQRKF